MKIAPAFLLVYTAAISMLALPATAGETQVDCGQFRLDVKASQSLPGAGGKVAGGQCSTHMSNGYPLPDPNCTPGAINPSVTQEKLRNPAFTTKCLRDNATTKAQKATTYQSYGIQHPAHNTGASQICELDHLISLELGGADTLDNIWPQCGPDEVVLMERYFKQKDTVENYLASQVRAGAMLLDEAQKGIATDWTQYIDAAKSCRPPSCRNGK